MERPYMQATSVNLDAETRWSAVLWVKALCGLQCLWSAGACKQRVWILMQKLGDLPCYGRRVCVICRVHGALLLFSLEQRGWEVIGWCVGLFRSSWKAHALLLRNKLRWQQSSHVTLIKEAPQYRVDPTTRKRRKFMGIWKGTGSICLQWNTQLDWNK